MSSGHFRPTPLLAPSCPANWSNATGIDGYKSYVEAYRFYLDSLAALRAEFWEESRDKAQSRSRKIKYFGTVPVMGEREVQLPNGGRQRQTVKVGDTFVVKVRREEVDEPRRPSPPTVEQIRARQARRRAANRRKRASRRARKLEAATKRAETERSLAEALAAKAKAELGWQVVTYKKEKTRKRLVKKGVLPEAPKTIRKPNSGKGKDGTGTGESPRPPAGTSKGKAPAVGSGGGRSASQGRDAPGSTRPTASGSRVVGQEPLSADAARWDPRTHSWVTGAGTSIPVNTTDGAISVGVAESLGAHGYPDRGDLDARGMVWDSFNNCWVPR